MDLQTFSRAFTKVRSQGWVKSKRKGDTGVGHTLEHYLGIAENNFSLADLGGAELKAKREGASSLITLFTRDRKAWKVRQSDAIRDFGSIDDDGRQNLYCTLFANARGNRFKMKVTTDGVFVEHRTGTVLCEWKYDDLAACFTKKFPALMLVAAKSDSRTDGEWFKYKSAKLLSGSSPTKFRNCLASGLISIDLRLYLVGKKVRNHGTAFRISEDSLPRLFSTQRAF